MHLSQQLSRRITDISNEEIKITNANRKRKKHVHDKENTFMLTFPISSLLFQIVKMCTKYIFQHNVVNGSCYSTELRTQQVVVTEKMSSVETSMHFQVGGWNIVLSKIIIQKLTRRMKHHLGGK